MVQTSYLYTTTGKTIALTIWTFVSKVMFLFFNILYMLVIAFLPQGKRLLILWLQSPSAVIVEPQKVKSATVSSVPHLFAMKWWDLMTWSSFLECWTLRKFFTLLFHFVKRFFSCSSLSAIRVVSSAYLRLLIFLPVILVTACASSSLAFHMMYTAYKLNKQGDSVHP